MVALYKRLAEAGVDKAYLKKKHVLPEWWSDEAALTPAGFSHGLHLIASHLGIEPASLREGQTPRFCRDIIAPCYKLNANATPADVRIATQIAVQAATLALGAMPSEQVSLPTTAAEIREEIRKRGVGVIDFRSLLDYCWSCGIPVIHLPEFPKGTRKMEGFAVRIGERFAIVLAKKYAYPAWFIFTLAHEIGHISKGHLIGREVIADEADEDVYAQDSPQQEREANAFALELLTGNPQKRFRLNAQYTVQLVVEARREAHFSRTDPGFVLMNHSYATNRTGQDWGKTQSALKVLEVADAIRDLQGRLRERLNWDSLDDESEEYLKSLMGLEGDDAA